MAFHSVWFDSNIQIWKKLLSKYRNKKNLLFLEIGCYEGRATLWLLKNILIHSSSKIEVVDTFMGGIEHNKSRDEIKNLYINFKANVKEYLSPKLKQRRIIIHRGESGIVLRKLGVTAKYDFIYIDGSHIAKDVLEDAVLSWRLLKKNGIMIFDDYKWRIERESLLRPEPAINSFLSVFQGRFKILYVGYQIAIQKIEDNNLIIPRFMHGKNTKETSEFDEAEHLRNKIEHLTKDLNKIQSAKTYIVWQYFCRTRNKIKRCFKKIGVLCTK